MTTTDFTDSEELRRLLFDLAYSGPRIWRDDPRAADLMTYTMEKYGTLAHKHGQEPTEAAAAAFEVMRMRSTRVAEDPWAVITHAVELTLIYESRAEGLLCSTGQARKTTGLDYHDAERFSDRESDIADYHQAFHFYDNLDDLDDLDGPRRPSNDPEPTNAYFALDTATKFFVELGWVHRTVRLGLEYIAARLDRCGDPRTAYVSLRRDGNGPGWLDVDQEAWLTMLRAMLGDPHADYAETARGRGILLRLLTGECLTDLFEDRHLADAVEATAPVIKASGESRA